MATPADEREGLKPRSAPELRCAVCHDSAAGAACCERCGTWVHEDCRVDGRCPTLGCGVRLAPLGQRLDPTDWRPLALLLLPLPLALVVGAVVEDVGIGLFVGVLASVVLWRLCYREDRSGPP